MRATARRSSPWIWAGPAIENMHVKQFALVAAFVVMTTSVTLTQSPDFSGMWTLDKNASDFTAPAFSGGRGGANIGRLFITHAANGTLIIGPATGPGLLHPWASNRLHTTMETARGGTPSAVPWLRLPGFENPGQRVGG